eukprot:m.386574 g.386574  ORF g.386574 m.386574 type:complete len:175 (-) comp20055_c1_seq3:214-738(-)
MQQAQLERYRAGMTDIQRAALAAAVSPACSPHPLVTTPTGLGLTGRRCSGPKTTTPGENPARQTPTRWPDHLLDMGCRELNRYLKTAGLSAEDVKDLKRARRRKKNRKYAQSSRKRRLHQYEQLAEARDFIGARADDVRAQIHMAQLRNQQLLKRQQDLADLVTSVNPQLLVGI